ncbi:Multidrug resistance protein stp [Streptomyces sp. ADI96-02]|uniref:MFS transporter n=1 Tax=Streptomyces sp. ADI96-02 TaxID=1522760 RepID=UPI000F5592BB|nr:MFS transporter [Streptomyces sp. ADI96-02]RPK59948.1 Multidrug resistance protein stp [Streptomyces sp. ADI96-02]
MSGAAHDASGSAPQSAPGRAARHGRWLLVVALTVQFLVSLDMSVVNVALPDIRSDLGFGGDGLLWVVNAYALAFGGLLMLGGRLADLAGPRRVLTAGLALFGSAGLAGGLAWSPGSLVAARAVQGVGAAALAPVAFALITLAFPAGPARSRALGLWGMAGAAGGAVGVLAGGLLTDAAGWRAVMLINVPIVAFALVAAIRTGPVGSERRTGARLDVAGALLATAGMTLLVLGLVRTTAHAWGSATTSATLGAAALLAAFVAVERRTASPLLRPGLLRGRPVLTANLVCLLLASAQFGAFYFVSLHLQLVLGYGSTAAGAAFLPFCAGIVVGSVLAPRAVAVLGLRPLMAVGAGLAALGMAWFAATATADGGFLGSVLGPSLLCSLGIGLGFVPLGTAATTDVAPGETGMASGLLNSSRQVGGSLGLAVLVTVATGVTGDGAGPAALSAGHAAAFWLSSAFLAVAALAAYVLLPGAGRRAAVRAAGPREAAGRAGERPDGVPG